MTNLIGAEWGFSSLQEFWESGLAQWVCSSPAIHTEMVQTCKGEITGGNLGTSPVSLSFPRPQAAASNNP